MIKPPMPTASVLVPTTTSPPFDAYEMGVPATVTTPPFVSVWLPIRNSEPVPAVNVDPLKVKVGAGANARDCVEPATIAKESSVAREIGVFETVIILPGDKV